MYVAENGTLVRDQATPERQISEVGDRMLAMRATPGAEPTLYPIPEDARPMLQALRRVLAGDGKAIMADFSAELSGRAGGWIVTLRPLDRADGAALTFAGCGDVLQEVKLPERNGTVRSITFAPWR
jgi:hypothetical protein